MNILSEIFGFLKDSTLSFGKKSLVLIVLGFALIVTNYFLGFTFNYGINQELNQLEKIEQLRNSEGLNDTIKNRLYYLENRIISRDYNYDKLISLIKRENDTLRIISDTLKTSTETSQYQYRNKTKPLFKRIENRNWKIDLVTSSYGLLVIMLFLLILPFFNAKDFWVTLLGAIVIEVFVAILLWGNYHLFVLIPIIWKPWINYLLNALIHFLLIITLGIILNKSQEKK